MNYVFWFFTFVLSSFLFGFIGDNSCSPFVSFFCFLFCIFNALCSLIVGFSLPYLTFVI